MPIWKRLWLASVLAAAGACQTMAPALTSALVAFGQDLLGTAAINYTPRYAESVNNLMLALAQHTTGLAFADLPEGYLANRRQQLMQAAAWEQQQAYGQGYGQGYGQPPGYGYGQSQTTYGQSSYDYGQSSGQTGGYDYGQSTGQTGGYDYGQSTGQTSGYDYGQSTGQTGGYDYGQSTGQTGGYDYGQSTGQTGGYDYGQSTGQTGGYDYGQSTGQTGGYDYSQSPDYAAAPQNQGYAQVRSPFADREGADKQLALDVALLAQTVTPTGQVGLRPVRDGDTLYDGGSDPAAGDKIKLSFRSNCDCYLYIIGIDATGWVTKVYPAPGDPVLPIAAEQDYLLPAGTTWWGLDQYKGVEQIYFVLSVERRTDIEQALASLPDERPTLAEGYSAVNTPAVVPVRGMVQVQSAAPTAIPTSQGFQQVSPTGFMSSLDSADLVVTRWFHHK